MKPSAATTLSRKPQGDREKEAASSLTDVAGRFAKAFRFGINVPPEEMLLTEDASNRILTDTAKCSRMTSFVSFHGDHAILENTFSAERVPKKIVRFRHGFAPGDGPMLVGEIDNPAS